MSEMTPMMVQYFEIKKEYPDTILFFRLGDFYEMFFDDAKLASSILELTLTSRACGGGEKAPMCGVPFHSADNYIAKLVSRGYKVAICEQVEDPATAKGIVKRDVIRVITKGSIIENSMLDESRNNYLTSVYLNDDGAGICFCDVSTGAVNLTYIEKSKNIENKIINELGVFSPSEIVLSRSISENKNIASFIKKKVDAICEIPDDSFAKKLYSTYLSYLPKEKASFELKMNVDARGSFTELLKTEKCGQFSVNISKPGITKGQHWHHTKWEFFIVVSGKGLIQQRKVGCDEVLNFEVSGEKIEAVHMLPGYTHNIINLSDTEDLVTVMWANECFDPGKPDTFFEVVE